MQRMAWAAGIRAVPRNALALGVYAVGLAAIAPAVATRRHLALPLLATLAAVGTVVYLRSGLLVLTAPCRHCGEHHAVGGLWCRRTGRLRTGVDRPLVQATVTVGLVLLLGVVAGAVRTIVLTLAPAAGPLAVYLRVDAPFFRASFLVAALLASVPVPVLAGSVLRRSLRADGATPAAAE